MSASLPADSDGVSRLWPEINFHFLSLQGIPSHFQADTPVQAVYLQLLQGFDAITSCEVKDLYKFKLCLQQLDPAATALPELQWLVPAFQAWVSFDHARARQLFRLHLQRYPSDVVALFCAHMFDFCSGQTPQLLPDLERCDPHLTPAHPLYSFYLAIKAFVLCEAGQAKAALGSALAAVRHCPVNIYGIHAVAHALHEQECWPELCLFLEQCRPDWIDNAGMRMHVYWHLAIAQQRNQQPQQAIATFHQMYALKDSLFAKQDLDAVAFLWRCQLQQPDDAQFEPIWRQLACLWSGSIGSSMSYFHKLHAALAFAANGQPFLIEKLIADSDGFGLERRTHQVGVAVLRAILHFARGEYQDCYQQLHAQQAHWDVLGGSRAQRELLPLTMHACARLGASTYA